ncbi:MAG: 2-dehydropantoate 2-reductase [Alphaproteobacteria bacterium]|jgi:2-dehydropantoate 2-reductase|nr:2-dehydropantoate 2-reductase [Alphaproteobacteria bacterium]
MRIAVVGAGGVGGYFGGRLAAAGEDVAFLARGRHLDALRAEGLAIRGPGEDLAVRPVTAEADPAAIGPVDAVIFAVKLFDTESAGARLEPLLGPETAVFTFQNGIDSVAILSRLVGAQRVVGGAAYISAFIERPGVIRHIGAGARLAFGEADGTRTPRVEALAAALARAGIDHEVADAIDAAIWTKFVLLSAISGLTALTRRPVAEIRANPETHALFEDAAAEAAAIAAAEGVALPADSVARTLATLDRLPPELKASMCHDLERGARLELPWFSGALVRLGRHHGIPTPVHRAINAGLILWQDGSDGTIGS